MIFQFTIPFLFIVFFLHESTQQNSTLFSTTSFEVESSSMPDTSFLPSSFVTLPQATTNEMSLEPTDNASSTIPATQSITQVLTSLTSTSLLPASSTITLSSPNAVATLSTVISTTVTSSSTNNSFSPSTFLQTTSTASLETSTLTSKMTDTLQETSISTISTLQNSTSLTTAIILPVTPSITTVSSLPVTSSTSMTNIKKELTFGSPIQPASTVVTTAAHLGPDWSTLLSSLTSVVAQVPETLLNDGSFAGGLPAIDSSQLATNITHAIQAYCNQSSVSCSGYNSSSPVQQLFTVLESTTISYYNATLVVYQVGLTVILHSSTTTQASALSSNIIVAALAFAYPTWTVLPASAMASTSSSQQQSTTTNMTPPKTTAATTTSAMQWTIFTSGAANSISQLLPFIVAIVVLAVVALASVGTLLWLFFRPHQTWREWRVMRGVRAAEGFTYASNRGELDRAAEAMAERQATRASVLASQRLTELLEPNRVVLGRVLGQKEAGKGWGLDKAESLTEKDSIDEGDAAMGQGQQRDRVQVDKDTGAEQIELQVVTSE